MCVRKKWEYGRAFAQNHFLQSYKNVSLKPLFVRQSYGSAAPSAVQYACKPRKGATEMKKIKKASWLDKIDSIIRSDSSLTELMLGASVLYGVSDPCGAVYSACAAMCGSKYCKEK